MEYNEKDKVAYENMLAFYKRKDVPLSVRFEYQVFLTHYLFHKLIKTGEGKRLVIDTAHCMENGDWMNPEFQAKCQTLWREN